MAEFRVGGIGKENQSCKETVRHHIALEGGETATYEGPMILGASVPALLGRKSLDRMSSLLDVRNMRRFRVGPGGNQLRPRQALL